MIGSLAIAGSAPARRAAIAAPFTAAGNAFLARKLADDHLHAGLQVTARHHRQRSVAHADRDLDRPRRPLLTLYVHRRLARGGEARAGILIAAPASTAARHQRTGDRTSTRLNSSHKCANRM